MYLRRGCPPDCPADLDNDGDVDLVDLATLLSAFGTTAATADLDCNGSVGLTDLTILLANFGTSCQ